MTNSTDSGTSAIPADPVGRYRHYKGGLYRVIGLALHSESRETLIVYVAEDGSGQMWVRPAGMFFETVTVDGTTRSRFERLPPGAV